MSSGKADSASLLRSMSQVKRNVRRSDREQALNPRYQDLDPGRGRGRARGGRGGGGGGGVDFDPPLSASGDVASQFFLEGPSRAETGSRAELEETEEEEEDAQPKKLRTRGESRVPEEKYWPKTQDDKWRIIPKQAE